MKRLPFLLLVCLVVTACASSGDFDALQRDLGDVRQQTADTRKEVDLLKERTTGVVREDSLSAMRDSQAQINSRLTEISNSLQELRGRFEEYKYSTEKSLRDMASERELSRAQIASLESQVRALKQKAGPPAEPAAPEKSEEASKEAPPAAGKGGASPTAEEPRKETSGAKTADYDAAYQLFREKKYKVSREKFEAFLKDSPEDKLAGNAQFWIAETYFAGKDYESAILAYETLLKKYPDSDKSSPASYKQALAFVEIGDRKTGTTILKKIVEKYPSSKEAVLARKKLSELERKPPGKRR
ncbi:MAG: tol-pal system protein YbgF [Nitrospiraceae bacterium]|nr:tol-pal system protein YbgF [Nitrospiraceae bacterium]